MNLQVFLLNESRNLETSSLEAFHATNTDGKSHYWIDIEHPDQAALSDFLYPLKLHPLIVEECLDLTATSRIAPYEHSLFIRLPVQLCWDIPYESFLSIICLSQTIISIHESTITALETITREFSAAVRFHDMSTAAILYQILDRLIDEDITFALEGRRNVEELEEVMDKEPSTVETDQILLLKKQIARLSIICEDQRYCITAMQTMETEFLAISQLREYFRDSMANLEYVIRSIGRIQTHLSELHNHYQLILQEKTNKRLRLLTILSAVFMPLSLIAGIYGMNFRYMPELSWRYGYPIVIAVMIILAGGLVWLFYWRNWFK